MSGLNRKIGKKINILLIIISVIFNIVGINGIISWLKNKQIITKPSTTSFCENCNIMIVDIDILRADALPCYGYFRNTAPNMCNFAKKSVIYTDNYSPAVWTFPSMFSTVTSLYPIFHGVREAYLDKLSPEVPTLAETLKKKGYKTIFVGQDGNRDVLLNWENGGLRGYDIATNDPIEVVLDNLATSSQPWFIHYYRADLHMPYLLSETSKPIENLKAPKNIPMTRPDFYRLLDAYLRKHYKEVFSKKAIAEYPSIIFGKNEEGKNEVSDLFFKLSFNMDVQKEYLIDGWRPIEEIYMNSFNKKNVSEVKFVRMMYDSVLLQLDGELKWLFQKLESGSLSKNTISIVMSDHGQAFGEHGTFSHNENHHTELFYTPLIIHSPNLAAKQVEHSTSNMDIFPTILDLLKIKIPTSLQGQSLLTYIDKPDFDPNVFKYSEDYSGGIILQNRKWLYYLPPDGNKKMGVLYDKIADPAENNNVANKYQNISQNLFDQASLFRSYDELIKSNESQAIDYDQLKLDPKKVEQLKKQGYF